MSRDLLREAIADAKAVKKMAIANAKQQIEEAFQPQLASMLSARLRNEVEDIMEDNDGSSEIGATAVTVKNPGPKEPSAKTSDSSHIENPGQEFDVMGDEKQKQPIAEDHDEFEDDDLALDADPTADAAAPVEAPAPEMDADVDMGVDAGMEADPFADGEVDELDLDAIIRELELDIEGDADVAAEPFEEEPALESFDQAQAGVEVDGAFDGALKEEAEGVDSDGKSPAPVDGVNGGKKVQPGQAVTGTAAETMTEGDEIDLDEILREMEAEEEQASLGREIAAENVELKRSLREHREVVQYLRNKLHEVNMLNSKLLFTNKLFRQYDLKLEQKMKIVETFDRATTLREVKLVYATLAESLGSGNAPTRKTKAITEGMASKPVASTAPKNNQIISEGSDLAARFKKLAGIK